MSQVPLAACYPTFPGCHRFPYHPAEDRNLVCEFYHSGRPRSAEAPQAPAPADAGDHLEPAEAVGVRTICSELRLSADRPEIDADFGPGLTETVGGGGPAFGENGPALRETDRRSLGQGRAR
jgi:hypothetical protein